MAENRLSDRRRLIVIGEAQNLNRDCFEYLRHLHDDPATRFALLFDGGDGCWEVLAREPMLRSRIYRRVAFGRLSDTAEPAVVWAIQRALGKRIEQLDRTRIKVWWTDAERWLVAHHRVTEELKDHVCGRLRIALMLVYSGPARTGPPATTTLAGYLAQQHRPSSAHVRFRPWPQVPRSHPLRLRYDCRHQLTPEEFARVERLVVGSLRTMEGRWWSVGYVAQPEIRSGLCVVGAAEDPEQAYVRRSGAELALICDQIPILRFQALRADGILQRSYGAYRASHIALYSSFMRDEPPTGSL